jgi:pimeloyl-ACP methyl ester carboxylesterase
MSTMIEPKWEQVIWQPKIDGRRYDVPIDYLANDEVADLHLYPGFGEERRSTERAIQLLSEIGVPTAGVVLPFHILEPTIANLHRTIIEAPVAIAETLNEQANRPTCSPVNIIGKSQGGGVALATAAEAPELFGALGIISPVGLTPESFGDTASQRRRNFIWRLGVVNSFTLSMNPLLDPGNFTATREVLKRTLDDVRAGRLKNKLDLAFSLDLTDSVKQLAEDHPIKIFVGEKDKVFRPNELRQSLGRIGCEDLLELTEGSHVPILNHRGAQQLTIAGNWIKAIRSGEHL